VTLKLPLPPPMPPPGLLAFSASAAAAVVATWPTTEGAASPLGSLRLARSAERRGTLGEAGVSPGAPVALGGAGAGGGAGSAAGGSVWPCDSALSAARPRMRESVFFIITLLVAGQVESGFRGLRWFGGPGAVGQQE